MKGYDVILAGVVGWVFDAAAIVAIVLLVLAIVGIVDIRIVWVGA